ncbi:SulP family inorganic anion transporter [Paenibacillus glycinis]|uniref:STAS domain-containing protein n=1 Tax=Paenibacillus glycinis TaxID=2697035 RepID=A0ABW9XWQ0_9BACL|nr:SulP family inorganic anion transporter [Paenibacillus glycinis]NBD27144.1 STAS domain-containing protein [Paenibacillus glycinis]
MKWTGRFAGYGLASLCKDLVSGLIVGIIAIPLGMAFAIASGVKPEYGLYTTIVAGIAISLFGGSKFQIGGPTGAFIPILLAIVMQYGYDNLLIAGLMAGILLVLMGLLRLGAFIRFIPRPVTTGFTAGIAVIIFSGQIANFLGLTGIEQHEAFLANMKEILIRLDTFNPSSAGTALICLAVMLLTPRFLPKVPGSLAGLLVSTAVAGLFFDGQVATIGSAFGAIPSTLPRFHIPDLAWERIGLLVQPAFVIAMLGGIESLLSAVVADGMTGQRHNGNRELIGQGIANIAAPLFGGIPATGAIARTATNIKNGAASPASGIIHGVVVLLVLVLFAPYASDIPLAGMAPILMLVAWNMSERKEFARVLKTRTGDSLVLAATFLLTVFTTLTTAVEVGFLLALLLFALGMRRTLRVSLTLPGPAFEEIHARTEEKRNDCPQIGVYAIEGPLFFGAADKFEQATGETNRPPSAILLLRLDKMPFMDMTGEHHLSGLVRRFLKQGGAVFVSGIQPQPLETLKKTGLYDRIGADRFFDGAGEAIDRALSGLDDGECLDCKHLAFGPCTASSNARDQPQLAAKPGDASRDGARRSPRDTST